MPKLKNVHPGEVLLHEFLEPLQITAYRLAREIGVQQTRIEQIVDGKRSITPDSAIRLARYFAVTPQFWLNLQQLYDLEKLESSGTDSHENKSTTKKDYSTIKVCEGLAPYL